MSQSKREELHKLMKESKTYSLPTSCTCGYVAKKNWIEMEAHYDKCAQFRTLVKSLIKNKSNPSIKSISDLKNSLEKVVPLLRQMELNKKNSGYAKLIQYKNELKMPEDMYLYLESCLDNPDKDYNVVMNFKLNEE